MQPEQRIRPTLAAMTVVAAATLLLLATRMDPETRQRDLLIGAVGLAAFGASTFAAGLLVGRRRRTRVVRWPPDQAERRAPKIVSPEEAKYWLQRFLEEHQERQRSAEGGRHAERGPSGLE